MGVACVVCGLVFSGRLQLLGAPVVRSQCGQSSSPVEKWRYPRPVWTGAARARLGDHGPGNGAGRRRSTAEAPRREAASGDRRPGIRVRRTADVRSYRQRPLPGGDRFLSRRPLFRLGLPYRPRKPELLSSPLLVIPRTSHELNGKVCGIVNRTSAPRHWRRFHSPNSAEVRTLPGNLPPPRRQHVGAKTSAGPPLAS
jgi:hypothetical protein